jgi:medium-chain acyl-[acyl-carrier-protein] hydrolase
MLLFCLTDANGQTPAYRSWSRYLPAEVRVEPVDPPSGAALQSPAGGAEALVSDATRRIRARLVGLPYAFFGHGLGALVAFEVGRRLRDDALLSHVFVSGQRAPHLCAPPSMPVGAGARSLARYDYRPQPPLPCGATAFGGAGDTDLPAPDLAAWDRHFTGGVAVRMIPGDRLFIDSAAAAVAGEVSRDLAGLLARLAPRL